MRTPIMKLNFKKKAAIINEVVGTRKGNRKESAPKIKTKNHSRLPSINIFQDMNS